VTATLYRDGHVRSPDHPAATALLVRGGAIAWVGDEHAADDIAADEADEVVRLAGALVTGAFVDAHVHATSTGLALTGLDLTGSASLADCLRQVEDAGRRARGGVVLGVKTSFPPDISYWPVEPGLTAMTSEPVEFSPPVCTTVPLPLSPTYCGVADSVPS